MELRYLRSFVILAHELHFGRAARQLHIVQPALSKQMKILEEEVGCQLLNRNRRGVTLSEAGKQFLAETEKALEHVERAIESARRAGLGLVGQVRIGYSASAVHSGVLASALTHIEMRMPEVEVVLERIDPWQQTERLLTNEIDFVIGPRPVGEITSALQTRHLAELEICVALSSRHPLANNDMLRAEDLKDENFIEFADSENEGQAIVMRLLNIFPRKIIPKPDPLSVLALVQAAKGICLLPAALMLPAFPQVLYKRLVSSTPLEVVAISRREDENSLLWNIGQLLNSCAE